MWKFIQTVLVVAILSLLVLIVAGNVHTLFSLHRWVRDYLGHLTGTDPAVAWLMAGALFALACLVPVRVLIFALVTGRPKPLIALTAACLAGAITLKTLNGGFKFDQFGNPTSSVSPTANGPVIDDAPPGSVDRGTGYKRKPLTAEILQGIKLVNGPGGTTTESNKIFNWWDGENKVWVLPGTCETRKIGGFDDRQRPLEKPTPEWADQCQKLQVEADRRRSQQAAAQERRDLQEEAKSRQRRFQPIGLYIAKGNFATHDGMRFFFHESVVLHDELHLKFRVVNVRSDSEIAMDANSRFEITIFNEKGTKTRSKLLRRVQGTISINAVDGFLVAPGRGETGWFVAEFNRDSATAGTFAIAINGDVAFNRPSDHIVKFGKF